MKNVMTYLMGHSESPNLGLEPARHCNLFQRAFNHARDLNLHAAPKLHGPDFFGFLKRQSKPFGRYHLWVDR